MVRTVGTDPGETKLLEDVEKFGWHCLNILAEGELPPYSFTVGLFHSYQHPELIIFGLPANVAHQILHIAAEAIKDGNPIGLALPTEELLEGYSCCFVEVPISHYRENVGFCRWFYEGDAFPLYQVVWPSREGLFPWHAAVSESFRSIQPVSGATRHGT
ncbi:DUF4262 domain-containing protein (plasmid) [Methylomonas sp. HW2-6]|uniref:DUF4262 domain-containing protein n=1 Tax=Methylomonas sp. HW2-6 TaxID=3376687 RepID=UPI004043417E